MSTSHTLRAEKKEAPGSQRGGNQTGQTLSTPSFPPPSFPKAFGANQIVPLDAELDGRLQDQRDLGLGGDLDRDVPEAGSYEHTDTELEDDSSDEDGVELRHHQSVSRSPMSRRRNTRRSPRDDASEMLATTSFNNSSPAILRHGARANNATPNILTRRPGL